MIQKAPMSMPKKLTFLFSSQPEKPQEPNHNDEMNSNQQNNQKQEKAKDKGSSGSAYCSLLIASINFAILGYYNSLSPEEKEAFLERFSMSQKNFFEKGQIYNLLTYGFVNTTDYQWLMGILVLGTVGAGLEYNLGSKLFLKYYLGGIMLGGLIILAKQMMNNTSYEQRGAITGQMVLFGAACRFCCAPAVYSSMFGNPLFLALSIVPTGIVGLITYLLHKEEKGEIDLDVKLGCLGLGLFYPSKPFFYW